MKQRIHNKVKDKLFNPLKQLERLRVMMNQTSRKIEISAPIAQITNNK
jgi:hypothetical protein